MNAAVFTLACGGWLVACPNGRTTIISPLPIATGQPAAELAKTLRDWADDIERVAAESAPGSTPACVRIIDLITGEIEESTLTNFFEAHSLNDAKREACERALKDFGAWDFGNASVGRKRVELVP